jgi:uncharacterized protein YndB with AHSA1/START domain
MSTVTASRTVDAPLRRVWSLLTDLPGRAAWLSTVDDIEVTTPGPFGNGTIWREIRTAADGLRVTEEFRVRECEPGRRFVVRSPGSGADYRLTYTLAPVKVGRHHGGTVVTIEQEGHANGPTGRVLELVLGGLAARTAEGALRQELDDLARAATGPDSGEEPAA